MNSQYIWLDRQASKEDKDCLDAIFDLCIMQDVLYPARRDWKTGQLGG